MLTLVCNSINYPAKRTLAPEISVQKADQYSKFNYWSAFCACFYGIIAKFSVWFLYVLDKDVS